MKSTGHPSNRLPPWQSERAEILQRACVSVRGALQRGDKIGPAIARASRRYHGKNYACDSARQIAIAPGTLRQLWDKWRKGGEVPAAFKLRYYGRPPYVPRPLLIRFAEFCASRRLPSVKAAWQTFSQIRGNFTAREISYQQICYSFKAADFYLMQQQLKAIETARAGLDQIKFKAIAEITEHLPIRPPRRRVKHEITFEI